MATSNTLVPPARKRLKAPRSTVEIDRHLAAAVLRIRNESGLPQQQVAAAIGISYQQLHKYETCKNRIPASRLYEICRLLRAPVSLAY